jgi:hypothetical protein
MLKLSLPDDRQESVTFRPEQAIQLVEPLENRARDLIFWHALIQNLLDLVTHEEQVKSLDARAFQVSHITVVLSH